MATKKKTSKRSSRPAQVTLKTAGVMRNLSVCYLPVVGGIPAAVYMVLETDRRVRWHAMQSLLLHGVFSVVVLATLGSVLGIAVLVFAFVFMTVLAVKMYRGEDLKVPMLSDWTEMIVHKGK